MRTRRHLVRFFLLAAVVAVFTAIGAMAAYLMAAGPRGLEEIPVPPVAIPTAPATPRYVGAGSCASRACHGNPTLTPGREWSSSFAVWVENDPHARAYNVLFTQESKNMAAALDLGEPWKAQRCLSCHSAPVSGSLAVNAKGDASTILADGVSCELCHGPAENYLAAHTIRAWLPKVMNDPHFGMNKTADIAVRGQICAGCHVGQPGPDGKPWRDVNHDLIAAGHPRLSFELSAFMATMPPHWNPRKNPERFDELKSWIDGQFTSADAALRVLGARAKSAGAEKPNAPAAWPEFAEYDCFACHHALNAPSWRQPLTAGSQHHAGVPTWGSWYYDGLHALADSTLLPEGKRSELLDRLNAIGDPLQTLVAGNRKATADAAKPSEVAKNVADKVPETLAKLDACRQALLSWQDGKPDAGKTAELRGALLKALWNRFQQHEPANWDEYAQYYLALVAIDRSQAAAKNGMAPGAGGPADRVLKDIRSRLNFDESAKQPANPLEQSANESKTPPILRVLRPGVNSPQDFNPQAAGLPELFRKAFQQLSTTSAPL
jgi:Cytochrome c554 and c-prime